MESSAQPSTTALLSDYDLELRDNGAPTTDYINASVPGTNYNNVGDSPNISTTEDCPVVEVCAPAALKGGYTFDVEVNGDIFTVVVPTGGVTEGQVFTAQTQRKIDDTHRIPQNAWKDNFFDIFRYGPFHSSFMLALCCPLLGLGQVMTRLNLTAIATPSSSPPPSKSAFYIMLFLTFLYFVVPWPIFKFSYFFLLFPLAAWRMRRFVREKYSIPPYLEQVIPADDPRFSWIPLGCIEDGCLSCCCRPCVIAQLSRHTAMYDTYDGNCCSSSGLPPYAPFMV